MLERTDIEARDIYVPGQDQILTRKFSLISMLSLSFCVLGTWAVFAQNLGAALAIGGPISIFWGLVLVTLCNLCVATSLGELCSSMPTALGQAYWVYRLWETPNGRLLSYICAFINTFGWWSLTASLNAFLTEFVLAAKVLYDPEWEWASTGWVQFLLYVGITVLFTLFNVFACRNDKILPYFNNFVGVGFVGLFVAISMALLISVGTNPSLSFQSATFVFTTWVNETDWSDGVIWFVGLVQAAYGLTAFDAVIHMAEEIPSPGTNAPRAIYLSVICGAVSGFLFMVATLFSIQDVSTINDSPTGLPFVEVLQSVLGLTGAAVTLSLFIINCFGQGVSVLTSASRLTWGFARDGGLPWGAYFGHVDTVWKAPIRALWLQCGIISLIGILYLFSNTVLSAILSVSTIALTISYAIPIAVLLVAGREKLPPREFSMGRFGPAANWVSLIYCAITSVFFLFPENPNPEPVDMNYAIAVFGVMLIVAVIFWVAKGRTTYLKTKGSVERTAHARELEVGTSEGVESTSEVIYADGKGFQNHDDEK